MKSTTPSSVELISWSAWLDVLSTVFPPRGTVVVGAGAGNGPWVQWLHSRRASPVWLLEGDRAQYQRLLRNLPKGCDWTPRCDVVAQATMPVSFYRASNPAESGLVPPERLRALWPNLTEDGAIEVDAPVTLGAVLTEVGDEANWLVVDCLPAAELLKGGGHSLGQLDVVLVRVTIAQQASGAVNGSREAVDEVLQEAGLVCTQIRAGRHPALAHALYVRNVKSLQVRADAAADALIRCEVLRREKDELQKRMEVADAKLKDVKKSVEKFLQREIANAVKQIESFIAIQSYLASGELTPELHGWPVSPDFALLLIEFLEQNDFDAVIEFGSGSSTLLIARALVHLAKKRPQHPRPIQVAFEHLEVFHARTAGFLSRAGLREEVMLTLAPLKPMKYPSEEEAFNYYDLENALSSVAQRLHHIREPKILVVVDGPPASVGPHARFPALPALLTTLPKHHGHLVLDDYQRISEKETVDRWRQMLEMQGYEYELSEHPLEKGGCVIRYKPLSESVSPIAQNLIE